MTQKTAVFDFDDTLLMCGKIPNLPVIARMKQWHAQGVQCIICTARNPEHEDLEWISENQPNRMRVADFVTQYQLPVARIIFTNHTSKFEVLKSLNLVAIYDNSVETLQEFINVCEIYCAGDFKLRSFKIHDNSDLETYRDNLRKYLTKQVENSGVNQQFIYADTLFELAAATMLNIMNEDLTVSPHVIEETSLNFQTINEKLVHGLLIKLTSCQNGSREADSQGLQGETNGPQNGPTAD